MKKISLLSLSLIIVGIAKSQPGCPSPFGANARSYPSYQVGIGGGFTKLKGDSKNTNNHSMSTYLNVDYQVVKGLFFGLRVQLGSFKMAGMNNDARALDSRYRAFGAGVLIQPIEMINNNKDKKRRYSFKRDLFESMYVGTDILNISNRFKTIHRNPDNPSTWGPVDYYDVNGVPVFKEKVNAWLLPSLNIGIAPALNRKSMGQNIIRLVVNAQFNFANNDDLDGYTPYNNAGNRINENNDRYNFYSLGLSYSF